MSLSTYIVDSFTDQPFKGNPAGVCLPNTALSDDQMLLIAQELGLSETAFITISDAEYSTIRFFSPKMEIPLCGHATLAAAKVLFQLSPNSTQIKLQNINKLELIIRKSGEELIMTFPKYRTIPCERPSKLIEALQLSEVIDYRFNKETKIILLRIESSVELKSLRPDINTLKASHDGINGVLITAASQRPNYDFESRYFWPWSGTYEDPVTGGTHTFLAPYWSDILGKSVLHSFQCSERTGFMRIKIRSDEKIEIHGLAQIVLKGDLIM